MITTTEFIIYSPQKYSIGINTEWKLTGEFIFNDKEELGIFRKRLEILFELVIHPPFFVLTLEEYQRKIQDENNLFDEHYENH